jgi:hypothetical protein
VIQLITCFQGPSGRRIGAAGTCPSAEEAEQTTLLGDGELIRRGRCGSGARQWRSRRDGAGIALAWRLVGSAWSESGVATSKRKRRLGCSFCGAAGLPAAGARWLVRARD